MTGPENTGSVWAEMLRRMPMIVTVNLRDGCYSVRDRSLLYVETGHIARSDMDGMVNEWAGWLRKTSRNTFLKTLCMENLEKLWRRGKPGVDILSLLEEDDDIMLRTEVIFGSGSGDMIVDFRFSLFNAGAGHSKNRIYSREVKIQAVADYMAGGSSLEQICQKYGIRSDRQLRNWIIWCNEQKEIRERHEHVADIYKAKGCKTTLEEKIAIVEFCLANGRAYGKAVEQFQVSYQQVYAWVKKYEENGPLSLKDGRGRSWNGQPPAASDR